MTLMDSYGADFSVLFVAICECIAVMWVYGKYSKNPRKSDIFKIAAIIILKVEQFGFTTV